MQKSKLPKAKKKKARDFPHSDAGNAELFAALKASNVRYDHRQGRWLIWNAKRHRWTPDMGHKVRLRAINATRFRLRESANISNDKARNAEANWALQSENRHRLDSALEIAKSLSPICDDGQGWDSDLWSFGVANGIVDLRTGKLKVTTQQDKLTKFSPLKFDPEAKCPRFEGFLNQIFNGDSELIRFIYKAVGYSLTGSVSEQCMFCCYGSGANGKSTLFGVLKYVFGDYCTNLPFSALELKGRSGIPNDLVMLVGRRFATAMETQEGIRLNEARIKALTGGDSITARRLYHEHFEFDPTHKIWLGFNHKPVIVDQSDGMWRRVRLVPFTQQFKAEKQDKNLLETLKAEAPGILAWAVRGCLLWQKEGLGLPIAVAEATAAYQSESDHLGQFLEECCAPDASTEVPLAELWRVYTQWTDENEETALSRRAFDDRIVKKGFQKGRSGHNGTHVYKGLRLAADTLTSADSVSDNIPHKEAIEEIRKNPVSVRQRVSSIPPRGNTELDAVALLFED